MKKYTLYAIGEITLVVLGILIALQINNWNQNNIDRKNETKALRNIKTDLEAQVMEFDRFIKYENSILNNAHQILSHFQKNNGFKNLDTLYAKINSLGSRATLKPFDTSFEELNSSGNLGLIKSDSLRFKIIVYYQDLKRQTNAIENNNLSINTELINNQFLSLTVLNSQNNLKFLNDFVETDSSGSISIPSSRFAATIAQQLAIPENELILFNIVNLRIITSTVHIGYYKKLKQRTEKLIPIL